MKQRRWICASCHREFVRSLSQLQAFDEAHCPMPDCGQPTIERVEYQALAPGLDSTTRAADLPMPIDDVRAAITRETELQPVPVAVLATTYQSRTCAAIPEFE